LKIGENYVYTHLKKSCNIDSASPLQIWPIPRRCLYHQQWVVDLTYQLLIQWLSGDYSCTYSSRQPWLHCTYMCLVWYPDPSAYTVAHC